MRYLSIVLVCVGLTACQITPFQAKGYDSDIGKLAEECAPLPDCDLICNADEELFLEWLGKVISTYHDCARDKKGLVDVLRKNRLIGKGDQS